MALHPTAGQGIFFIEVSRSHTHTHIQWDSSGRVINPMQIPLPDSTQHSQVTDVPPAGFEPAIPGSDRPQVRALTREAAGFGFSFIYCNVILPVIYVQINTTSQSSTQRLFYIQR